MAGLIPDTINWFQAECLKLGGVSGGIYANKKGFHNTVNNNLATWPDNYSINPAIPELRNGPRDKARAFDWTFPDAQTKNYFRINKFCALLDAASRARDPRLRWLYEWFGTKDGANIGWNVWKNRFSSSDDSHDWHIHFSVVTAYLLDQAGPSGVLSVLKGEPLAAYQARGGTFIGPPPPPPAPPVPPLPVEEDDMYEDRDRNVATADTWRMLTLLENRPAANYQLPGEATARSEPNRLAEALARIEAKPGVALTDADLEAIATKVAAKLAALVPSAKQIAEAVLDEDHERSAD